MSVATHQRWVVASIVAVTKSLPFTFITMGYDGKISKNSSRPQIRKHNNSGNNKP